MPPRSTDLPAGTSRGPLVRGATRALAPILRVIDSGLLVGQLVLKVYGFQSFRSDPPERFTKGGFRLAVLPHSTTRWPSVEVPLPPTAVFKLTAESILQRLAVWEVPDNSQRVANFYRTELTAIAAPAREYSSGESLRIYFARDPGFPDILTVVKIQARQSGGSVVGVTQLRRPGRTARREEQAAVALMVSADPPPPDARFLRTGLTDAEEGP